MQHHYKNYIVALVFGTIFTIYSLTMLPSQAFHDAGEFQTVIHTMQIAHPTGFPTYILIGKAFTILFPFAQSAWVANFLSLLYSLATLYFIWKIAAHLTQNSLWALSGVTTYAFVEAFWYYAGIADSHTLNRLFIFALSYLLIKVSEQKTLHYWYLYTFLLGLGLGNHLFLVYALPGFAVWILILVLNQSVRLHSRMVLITMSLLLLGLSVYLLLPLRGYAGTLSNATYSLRTWDGFYRHVFGGDFHGLMYQGGVAVVVNNMLQGVLEIAQEVTWAGFVAGLFGLACLLIKKRDFAMVSLIMFSSFLLFSRNYPTSDPSRYYMAYVGVCCIWISYAFYSLDSIVSQRIRRTRYSNIIVSVTLTMISLLAPINLFHTNYQQADKSNNNEAEHYARTIFSNIEQDAIILTWWNFYTPLWYRQEVLGERADITLEINGDWTAVIQNNWGTRPIYLVELTDQINSDYQSSYQHGLHKLTEKRE